MAETMAKPERLNCKENAKSKRMLKPRGAWVEITICEFVVFCRSVKLVIRALEAKAHYGRLLEASAAEAPTQPLHFYVCVVRYVVSSQDTGVKMLPCFKPGVCCKRAQSALVLAGASLSTRLIHVIIVITYLFIFSLQPF